MKVTGGAEGLNLLDNVQDSKVVYVKKEYQIERGNKTALLTSCQFVLKILYSKFILKALNSSLYSTSVKLPFLLDHPSSYQPPIF